MTRPSCPKSNIQNTSRFRIKASTNGTDDETTNAVPAVTRRPRNIQAYTRARNALTRSDVISAVKDGGSWFQLIRKLLICVCHRCQSLKNVAPLYRTPRGTLLLTRAAARNEYQR